ncbi:cob(I)yrinic acid a,c-diamide adenosyltransferase [Candidatus Uhrbacteria bacterium]|nr:cob(I)yrinic acid a,c-diamide adenosyltransferase [Candidatus Uhrbacteria bacterium]
MEKKLVANKAVIVNPQGKILLVRDAGKFDHTQALGKWDFPGGRMDALESPQEGLLRELKEEVGFDPHQVHIQQPLQIGFWGMGGDIQQNPVVGIFYLVRLLGEVEIVLSEEHTEFFWFDPKQTIPNDVWPRVSEAIEAYRRQEGIAVASDAQVKGYQGYGLIQLFTGNGKGKTTAALGEVLRAVGAGKKVGIVFFDKGGETHYFERKMIDQIEGIDYVATGRDRIDPVTGRFDFSIQEIDKQEGKRGLEEIRRMFKEGCDLVVMDEINSSADLGIVSIEEVLSVLDEKPKQTELIMTGRNAPEAFLTRAHLVTEMRLRKHYFYSGVKAREGLDY